MIVLPQRTLQTTTDEKGRLLVRDPVRRKWVRFTPEEEVRQQLLLHLVEAGFPAGLLAVERAIPYLGQVWRADVVAYDRRKKPLLLAECKSPDIPINQRTFDQLARYNVSLGAGSLLATNGSQTLMCVRKGTEWAFVESIPTYGDLVERE